MSLFGQNKDYIDMTRNQIIKEARSWLGTPYQHQAKVKGVGVDCAMLIAEIGNNLGLIDPDKKVPNYSKQWHLHNKEEKLKDILLDYGFLEIPLSEAKTGDVLGFKYGRVMSHLAIRSPRDKIIQASMEHRKVTESTYDDMKSHLITAFKFPGV